MAESNLEPGAAQTPEKDRPDAQPEAPPAGEPTGAGPDSEPPVERALAEMEDRWRRALAEAENLRKRYARRLPEELAAERDRVSAAWPPVLDNLDRAVEHAGGSDDAVAAGVRAVRDQAVQVLERLGYARHDETGVPFDPERHEAVTAVPRDDVKPFTVIEVLRPGYGDGQRQLRPAAVVVSTGQE
jgi:molecular chaperone GrpE